MPFSSQAGQQAAVLLPCNQTPRKLQLLTNDSAPTLNSALAQTPKHTHATPACTHTTAQTQSPPSTMYSALFGFFAFLGQ
jgi:hypothetical protein